VGDPGIFRINQQVWQKANIMAAAAYFREILSRDPQNLRVSALYEGLLDVVEPTRRVVRQQRELATVTSASHERRRAERRTGRDRRERDIGVPAVMERRTGHDRRTGRDRRKP
jgi:hypothetical protein